MSRSIWTRLYVLDQRQISEWNCICADCLVRLVKNGSTRRLWLDVTLQVKVCVCIVTFSNWLEKDGVMWLMCVCTSVSVWGFDDTSSTAQAEAVFRNLLALLLVPVWCSCFSSHLVFICNPHWSRLAVCSAFPVWARLVEIRSHVWPVVCEGELLGGQRLQDLTHQPPAGAHVRHQPGPQRPATQNQPAAVSAIAPAARLICSSPQRH